MKKTYSRGFTLIELLVVIAIIGILSAVVLTSLGTARGKARVASVQQTMHGIQAAASICLNDGATVSLPTDTRTGGGAAICSGSTATYVSLPAGWIYCDGTSGTQAAESSGSGNCGNEISTQTSSTFWLVAESVVDGQVIGCNDSYCAASTTNPD